MKMLGKCAGFALAAALALFATGCSKSESDTINIGGIFPLSGDVAVYGVECKKGIDLAIDEINEAGGVNGKKIVLIGEDDEGKPDKSVNAFKKLTTKDKVKFVIGSLTSGCVQAVTTLAQAGRVIQIAPAATSPAITEAGDYIFRACFIDPFQGTVMATYANKNLNAKTAVLIREISNDYSVGLAKFFSDTFKKLAGESSILAELNYNTGDQDFTAQLTTIKASNPDVIFAPGNYTESALIMKQARELGITAPFLGGDTWETPELIDVGKDAVEGCLLSTAFDAGGATGDLAKTFLAKYEEKYHKEPAAFTVLAFDGYRLILDAIRRADSIDTTKIRDAIAATRDFEGVAGNVTLDENGDATKSAFIKTVKDGKFTYITIVNP